MWLKMYHIYLSFFTATASKKYYITPATQNFFLLLLQKNPAYVLVISNHKLV